MNSWPFHELKRQVECKAAWEGVPAVTPSEGDEGHHDGLSATRKRLRAPVRGNSPHYRQLWCQRCERWDDRDLVAVMNISRRAWLRFGHVKGGAGEAVKGNPDGRRQQVILRVDASKPSQRETGVLKCPPETPRDETEP